MSKNKQTPAEVAQTLAKYIARQEETLRSFPVGPLGNSARRNLQRGREALALLQGQNERMRMERDPAMQGAQMSTGGTTYERSLRNFNPGNLRKWGDQPIEDGFAVFETPEAGFDALLGQLNRYKTGKTPGTSPDMTLYEAMEKYAPSSDNNNPKSYAEFIAKNLGIDPNTAIKDIDTKKWATAVTAKEGGQMYAYLQDTNLLDDAVRRTLPAVRDATRVAVQSFDQPVFERLRANPEREAAQSNAAATEALQGISGLADLSAQLNPELAAAVDAARASGAIGPESEGTFRADSPEPRPKGTMGNTALEQFRDGPTPARNLKDKKLYDMSGRLLGTYVGAGKMKVADGSIKNLYESDVNKRRNTPIFYTSDGQMIGRYVGGGNFNIDRTGKNPEDKALRGAQALERLRIGQSRRQESTGMVPGTERGEDLVPLTPRGPSTIGSNVDPALLGSYQDLPDPVVRNFDDVGSDTTAATPDQVNFEMPGMSYLSAIPAMASLASAGIQQRALNQMVGPTRPITTDIPAFNYESTIGQQLQDVRDATDAASRVDGLSVPQRAAMRQGLLAQRFRQEQQLRGLDNRDRQNARARYDMLSMQARQANDALRNDYLQRTNEFNNQKAMLQAQIKQQPLNVLSASAQDYLQNVYAPNLAAQLEGMGRQYNTNIFGVTQNEND